MKEKRYSISHVQQMIDISPAELQKLIKKNATALNVSREDLGNGKKEICLDEESLQRLIFIKQLEKGGQLSDLAVCEMIKVPQISKKKAGVSKEEEFYSRLLNSIEAVSTEADQLKSQLHGLMIKYDHVIKQLNVAQARNITFEKEIGTLRNREAALMGHLRQSAENFGEDELDNQLVN